MQIVIIGNASTVLEQECGSIIDNFNQVVRLNDFVIDGYQKYIGNKTTIWSTGAGIVTVPRDSRKFKEVWVSYPSVCINMMSQLANRVTKGNSFTLMGYNFVKDLDTQLQMPSGMYCTSGMYAIGFALLRYKQVHIHGFNFFKDCNPNGNTNHYYGEHATEKVGQHRMDLEEIYINELIKTKKVVKL